MASLANCAAEGESYFASIPSLETSRATFALSGYRVVKRFPAAVLAHGPLHRFGAGGAPVLEPRDRSFFKARFDRASNASDSKEP